MFNKIGRSRKIIEVTPQPTQDEAHLLPFSPKEIRPVERQATTIEVGITVPVGCSPGDSFVADWNGFGPSFASVCSICSMGTQAQLHVFK